MYGLKIYCVSEKAVTYKIKRSCLMSKLFLSLCVGLTTISLQISLRIIRIFHLDI